MTGFLGDSAIPVLGIEDKLSSLSMHSAASEEQINIQRSKHRKYVRKFAQAIATIRFRTLAEKVKETIYSYPENYNFLSLLFQPWKLLVF